MARLSRSSDANDLTWATLQDQKIANADVMAGNSNGVRPTTALDVANSFAHAVADSGGSMVVDVLFDDDFLAIALMMGMEWVEDAVSSLLNSVAE